MKKSYIILAHHLPSHLKRLILALSDRESDFHVHVDLKTDLTSFTDLISMENVNFVADRFVCSWGGFSLVDATLSLFRSFLSSKVSSEYVIFLSGQHYPLVSNEKINAFLEAKKGTNFQSTWSVDHAWTPLEREVRSKFYRFEFSSERGDFVCVPHIGSEYLYEDYYFNGLQRLLADQRFDLAFKNKVLKTISAPRQLPQIPMFRGSQWFCFTSDMVAKMMAFLDGNSEFMEYFKFTHIPDEILFATSIKFLQSQDPSILIEGELTYIDWTSGRQFPTVFEKDDFPSLVEASHKYLFARKFDEDISIEALDMIDDLRGASV